MDELREFKCPCCGGAIEFSSEAQKMKCPYCDTEFEMETLRAYDESLREDGHDDIHWETSGGTEWRAGEEEGMRVYSCRSCGGEIVCDENTAATSCPYCGDPVVMTGSNLSGALRPDLVIPFKLDKKAAKAGLEKHLANKYFLPAVFRSQNHIDEIKGIYVPVWLFDADVSGNFRYRATQIRTWSDSDYIYTETSHFAVLRGGNVSFASVPVDGSSAMPDDIMESIEPFDISDAVDFQTAYLSGFLADKYDVDAEESIDRANERVRHSTEQAFASTVSGYSSVMPEGGSMNVRNGKAKYVHSSRVAAQHHLERREIYVRNERSDRKVRRQSPARQGKVRKNLCAYNSRNCRSLHRYIRQSRKSAVRGGAAMKKITSVILAVLLCFSLALTAMAVGGARYIVDEGDRLTGSELSELEGRAEVLYDRGGIGASCLIVDSLGVYTAPEYIDDVYADNCPASDAVVLLNEVESGSAYLYYIGDADSAVLGHEAELLGAIQ